MNARSVVHNLLTAYLVSVLTGAWLAVMAGGLRVLGWLWAPVLTGAMAWLQVWGPMLAVSILLTTAVVVIVVMSIQMWRI